MYRLILASTALLIASTAVADDCKHQAARNLDIDATGLKTLAIEPGWSDIKLQGVAGLARIEVRGKACASSTERLEGIRLLERRDGDRVVGRVEYEAGSWSLIGYTYATLGLEVRSPETLALEISSGSGDAVVADVASLDWNAGSGDLEVRKVAGLLRAKVGSGDVDARDVGAFTLASTGSGDFRVEGVRGDVEVGSGGSGDLTFHRVDGSVRIGNIGSGDVELHDIGGSVTVESIGSGDVSVDGVRGDLTVTAQGSGTTSHRNVAGKVDVPADD